MGEIYNAQSILNKILAQEFTAIQSFKIGKILKRVNEEMTDFNKIREKMIYKYAEIDEAGEIIVENGNIKIKPEKFDSFQKELEDLLSLKINIEGEKIPIEWLGDLKITPKEIIALEAFLE